MGVGLVLRWLSLVVMLSQLGLTIDNETAANSQPPVGNETNWARIGTIGSLTGYYLGNGWVLTANHVGVGNFTLNAVVYTPIAGTLRQLGNGLTDAILFQVTPTPPGDLAEIEEFHRLKELDPIIVTGLTGGRRWGTNLIGHGVPGTFPWIPPTRPLPADVVNPYTAGFTLLRNTAGTGGTITANETAYEVGDSGSPIFHNYKLAGIGVTTGTAVDLTAYRTEILGIISGPDVCNSQGFLTHIRLVRNYHNWCYILVHNVNEAAGSSTTILPSIPNVASFVLSKTVNCAVGTVTIATARTLTGEQTTLGTINLAAPTRVNVIGHQLNEYLFTSWSGVTCTAVPPLTFPVQNFTVLAIGY